MKFTNKLNELKFDWKKMLPYLAALVVFVAVSLLYCLPQFNGKVLQQGDTDNWRGGANEALTYLEEHGEPTAWTNSMFSGMPTYQITFRSESTMTTSCVKNWISNLVQEPITAILLYFVGFFIMLLCFGINAWLALIGALAIGLSSYFFIIIPAGHMTKAYAIGGLAPVIGGMYAIFRKNYRFGIPVMLLFGSYAIVMHPQMTYYIFLLLGVLAFAELYIYIRAKEWKSLGINIGILALCMGLIFVTKLTWWQQNQEYLGQTMRGGHSELTQKDQKAPQAGLDIKYATDWSYGIDETMTFLIPNWEGGSSHYNVGPDSRLGQELKKMRIDKRGVEQLCKYAPMYHGEKQFTSGAVYMGAMICFLFLLGLLIVPGPYKWALLFATLMSVFLAWGKHMMWFTEFFFNYFPMYNKFRAVESSLLVAEITMPLLGFLGLQKILNGEVEWKKLHRSLIIAGAITAGICLVVALSASSINMTSSYDDIRYYNEQGELVRSGNINSWISAFAPQNRLSAADYQYVYDKFYPVILEQRQAMLTSDAWRSFIFIIFGFGLVYGYAWLQRSFGNKLKYKIGFIAVLAGLILADMIPVNKRFFGDDNYVSKQEADNTFKIQPWEKEILQDTALDFRVYNLAANTFNDSRTSYRLKSIGGYSAAKLRRYQDLIDAHLLQGNPNVINMLNTKYIITRQGIYPNDEAMGNAWFVDNVQFVPTPDDESNALYSLDLHTTAVADEKFRDVLSCEASPSALDAIELTEYQPNKLTYEAYTASDRVAVFSEIYYPEGWHLYIDGNETKIGRVNYVLRAAVIPAGEHTIVMEFRPASMKWDKFCAAFAIILFVLSIAMMICWPMIANLRCSFFSRKNEANV